MSLLAAFLLLAGTASAGQDRLTRLQGQAAATAEKLRAIEIEEEAESAEVVEGLLSTLEGIKKDPATLPEMRAAISRAEDLARDYPKKPYAKSHPYEIARAIARQLEFSAAKSKTPEEFQRNLVRDLSLPRTLEELPTDLTLDQYKALGPIVIFLLKHRTRPPASYIQIDPVQMMHDAYHAQIGVTLRGRVDAVFEAEDGDFCFNISVIHNEITPELRDGETLPKVGDIVEISGWSYYDTFHQDETPKEQAITKGRPTVWEVHPVMNVTVLSQETR